MAGAFAKAVQAGYEARLAGRIPRRYHAEASSAFDSMADLRAGGRAPGPMSQPTSAEPDRRAGTRAVTPTPKVALTIAGTDSGGGAGIAADLRTFGAFGVFGTLVVTAVTAQNTVGVRDILAMTPEMVAAQLDAVLDDLDVRPRRPGCWLRPVR